MVNEAPALLTGHHYPLGCAQIPAPSITRLLSPRIRRLEGFSLLRYVSVSRASEIPFRLDETNTVSCGGVAGISNTFASALWAVSYLRPRAMSMDVSGINLQGNPANCGGYTPVCAPTAEALAAGALGAQPEWYALLLARALIGDRPLPVEDQLARAAPTSRSPRFAPATGAFSSCSSTTIRRQRSQARASASGTRISRRARSCR